MNSNRILLVNLSKGLLGDQDARLLGMLILGKIYSTAMQRTEIPMEARTSFSLYIDEFQNLATDTAADMLAEGRKYGLRLVLANQHLAQLGAKQSHNANLAAATLGNVGSLLCFRLGPNDAEQLQGYFDPGISPQELQYLPDYYAASRLLINGKPVPPFVIGTRPLASKRPTKALLEAIARSREKHSVSIESVEESLRGRRKAILMQTGNYM